MYPIGVHSGEQSGVHPIHFVLYFEKSEIFLVHTGGQGLENHLNHLNHLIFEVFSHICVIFLKMLEFFSRFLEGPGVTKSKFLLKLQI